MSDYEVIFGLDCVGGDQAPIDCAIVKTSDGKPGIMLEGDVFTKDSLTPAENKLVPVVEGAEVSLTADDLAGATQIRSHAFYSNSGLTSIVIPDSVTNIGGNAFYTCDNLTSVVIGSGIEEIGTDAFVGCNGLTLFRILATTPPSISSLFGSTSGGGITTPPCVIYVPEESVDAYKAASGWSVYAAYIEEDPN